MKALAKEKYHKGNILLINWALKYERYFLQYFDISPLYQQHLTILENGNTYQLNTSDFKHIIDFSEIYSRLFYEDKLLAERLNIHLNIGSSSPKDYHSLSS